MFRYNKLLFPDITISLKEKVNNFFILSTIYTKDRIHSCIGIFPNIGVQISSNI